MDFQIKRRASSIKEYTFLGSVGDIDRNVLESMTFKKKKEYIALTKCHVCEIDFSTIKNPEKHW